MRILLVDDEPGIAGALSAFLRLHGLDVQEAHDFAPASAMLEEGGWSLLITDQNLPGGQGLDLCRQFHQSESGLSLLLSAREAPPLGSLEDSDRVFFLPKPIAPGKLLAWIREKEGLLNSSENQHGNTKSSGMSQGSEDPFQNAEDRLKEHDLSPSERDHCLCALFPSLLHGALGRIEVSDEVVAMELELHSEKESLPRAAVEDPFPGSDLWLVRDQRGVLTGVQLRVFRKAAFAFVESEEKPFLPQKFHTWEGIFRSYEQKSEERLPRKPSWLRFGLEVLRRERMAIGSHEKSTLSRLLWTNTEGLGEMEQ